MTAPDSVTQASLVADLRQLGLVPKRPVLVHSSLRRAGPIVGGAATLLAALRLVIGDSASVVVPTHTANNSLTSPSFHTATDALDATGRARYIDSMAGFDPRVTPSYGMGVFAEFVRRQPGAVRSAHPQTSFAAIGPDAAELMSGHRSGCHLGPDSPLGALYRRNATVLLLGVGFSVCTAFHLAEYMRQDPPTRTYHCFVGTGTNRRFLDYTDVDLDDSDFDVLGKDMENSTLPIGSGPVGRTTARVIEMKGAVDFATVWLNNCR